MSKDYLCVCACISIKIKCIFYIIEVQEFYLRSQAVQRNLPRPSDINTTILRGTLHPEQKMKSLYEVCTYI